MTAGEYPVSELQDKRELLLGTSNTVADGKMNENREFHTHTTGVMNLALKLVIPAASLSAEATVEVGLHDSGAIGPTEKLFSTIFHFVFGRADREISFSPLQRRLFIEHSEFLSHSLDLIISHNFNHDFSLNSFKKCSPTHGTPATNTSSRRNFFSFYFFASEFSHIFGIWGMLVLAFGGWLVGRR